MRRQIQQADVIGLLLVSVGASLVVCLLGGEDAWPRALPGVLIGLSMISFGWSSLAQRHRR